MQPTPKIIIQGDALLNLIDELLEWERVSREWYDHITEPQWEHWKRSPARREDRRESVVYRNCLTTITCALGRKEMVALMARVRAEQGVTE